MAIDTIEITPRDLDLEMNCGIKEFLYDHIVDTIVNWGTEYVLKDSFVMKIDSIIKEYFKSHKVDLGNLQYVTHEKDSNKFLYFIYYFNGPNYFDGNNTKYKVEIYDWAISTVTIISDFYKYTFGDFDISKGIRREEINIPLEDRKKIDIDFNIL